jgi:fumarate reductase subunit C
VWQEIILRRVPHCDYARRTQKQRKNANFIKFSPSEAVIMRKIVTFAKLLRKTRVFPEQNPNVADVV